MTDIMEIETPAEADAVEAQIKDFRKAHAAKATELDGLTALEAELTPAGPNPYSIYTAADLAKGFVTFNLHKYGEWVEVSVDTLIPCDAASRSPLSALGPCGSI